MEIPKSCIVRRYLVDEIYGERIDPNDIERLKSSVILAPRNDACAAIFPIEFIDTLMSSGMPPHILVLKVGFVVMFLRNLDMQCGL